MQLLLTDVSSAAVRKQLLEHFEAYGPVELLPSAAELKPRPAVVVGDLHRIAQRFPPASGDPLFRRTRGQPVVVAGLLRTERDQRAVPDVPRVMRSLDDCFLVRPFPDPEGPDRDREFVGQILQCVSPDFLTTARFSPDGSVALRFGDGLIGRIDLRQLRLARLGRRIVPETVRASSDGDSLQIDDETGYTIDIDSEVLRGLLEPEHAIHLREQAKEVRCEVGKRIRGARHASGVTQVVLSKRSGIAQEAISRIENGKQAPRADTLLRIARALDTPLGELLGGEPCR